MSSQRNHIDLAVLIAVLALMVLSLGVVYSASSTWAMEKFGESGRMLGSHAIKVLVGFLAILTVMHVDYRIYKKVSKPVLIMAALVLCVTLAFGGEVKGATRWLRIGGFGFQPSEFAKLALIVHLCALLAVKNERIKNYQFVFVPMVIWIGMVTVLVLAQPNFSNGMMIFGIGILMLFVGRARILHIALTFGPLLLLLGGYMLSAGYRVRRVMSFISGADGAGGNYQLWQGIIGFGNGGIFGVGPGESRQRDLFLPESYGDFVFSIVGEEYGLVGTLLFLLLFLTIMLRGMRIAKYARDDFGRYLAVGITASITFYALINAGVTLGILPTTGLPMPFVSYGGSSMFFSSIAIGILLNISSQTSLYPRMNPVNGVRHAPDNVRPLEPAPASAARPF